MEDGKKQGERPERSEAVVVHSSGGSGRIRRECSNGQKSDLFWRVFSRVEAPEEPDAPVGEY
jgi:hypothetical protein